MKHFLGLLLTSVLMLLLCGCELIPMPTKPAETEPPVEQVAMVVTAEDLVGFEAQYPALKTADFRGSTCYDAIEAYMAAHPGVDVRYTVSLGPTEVDPDIEILNLNPTDFDYDILRSAIAHLHKLRCVNLSETTLTLDAILALEAAYPDIAVVYSVNICGQGCGSMVEEIGFSDVEPAALLAQADRLALLPNLKTIYLMTAEGESLYSLEDAAALQAAVPDVQLIYSFTLFGKKVSTTDEEIVYANQNIAGQEGALDTLRMALGILRGCGRFVLDNCKFSNETLAALRDEFRGQTKIVWRVWFGDGGCLTDREVIRHVYGLYDYNSANLIYCEDAQFVDFGHNEILKQCAFVAGMPNLRAIILSGSMVADLSPFEVCHDLEFLELAYCGYVTDLSPLASCTNLKRLNIAYTKADDLSALDELNLEVLVDARSKTDAEDWAHFEALHPDCIVQHTGDAKDDQPYNYPWRYERDGEPNPYYALLKEKFNYPNPSNTLY